MAVSTVDEIKALNFGYLTGADIIRWCAFQFIQKQLIVDPDSLEIAVQTSYSELKSKLITKCDIDAEFEKRGTERYQLIVKMASIATARNITGDAAGLPDKMLKNFDWLDQEFRDIRNGNESLPNSVVPSEDVISKTGLIQNSFGTIG